MKPFVPLALVTSMLLAIIFVVVAPLLHLLFRCYFDFCALAVGMRVWGRVPFMGYVACAPFQYRRLTPAVKRGAALVRVAPYF